MTDYVPIDCDQHSVLELLAMHRTKVTVEAVGAGAGVAAFDGTVVDVLTRAGAEYLALESDDGRTDLRLDRLLTIRDGDGAVVWRQETGKRR